MIPKYSKTITQIRNNFWIILKFADRLEHLHFSNAKDMDAIIEDIVVSHGEEGREHNIVAQSLNYKELQEEIKRCEE